AGERFSPVPLLLEAVEERQIEIGHSDRSRSPIEPYLSKQWFVRTEDIPGGVLFGRGTAAEFTAPGLAQAAIEAASGEWSSHSGRRLAFHPDPVRYGNTYRTWLAEKRDWCISRQLWWGHRIPIWAGRFSGDELRERITAILAAASPERLCVRLVDKDGASQRIVGPGDLPPLDPGEEHELLACLREPGSEESAARALEENGLERDPDVLDTWFSSGIWPHSTLGWPDPQSAAVEDGQAPLGAGEGGEDCLAYYYPGSCLVTGRDIITLWVARMVMMGLYNIGDLPFTDVFIHANILDGNGERMSKSKGNGIDPVDIIARYGADAMRYVLAEMQTGTQDIRLPVQAISPFTGDIVDLATAKHGSSIFTYLCPKTGKEFDVLGTMPEIPSAKLLSERFEVGRNFCNKLWNAVRFALPNLEEAGEEGFRPLDRAQLADEDRWILSRLSRCVAEVNDDLEAYNPSAAISSIREFFWGELCDWYLELIKPRLREEGRAPVARRVLAAVIDPVLRLLHPFIPFVSEALWRRLNERAPERGVDRILPAPEILAVAPWPEVESHRQDDGLEERFRLLQEAVRAIREVRSRHNVPPSRRLEARVRAGGESAAILRALRSLMATMAQLAEVEVAEDAERSADAATAVVRDVEIYLPGAVDIEKEKARLGKQREELLRRLDGSRKKLANESFVTRAKPEVVDRERRLLADLEARLKTVDSSLAAMG
ncbi:MAG: class I tRNA ligase family protein, partial [Planctomycetota bacterium]